MSRDNLLTAKDLIPEFIESLAHVGAEVIKLNGKDSVLAYISENYPECITFENKEIWEEYSFSCSKEKLEKLGTIQLEGKFGVAENGAIWLDDNCFPNRLLPFIAQKVIILLDSGKIVKDMGDAYDCVNDCGYGVFISGPSKTADIEQSLVFGAHGPKSLLVTLF